MLDAVLQQNADEYQKVINISPKHQITIPQKFYTELNFGSEAICILRDEEIVIRPIKQTKNEDFTDMILADLIEQGYHGAELLEMFKQEKLRLRAGIAMMLQDAEAAAHGKGEFYTEDEVFGEED